MWMMGMLLAEAQLLETPQEPVRNGRRPLP
jgi:hypothetical protein